MDLHTRKSGARRIRNAMGGLAVFHRIYGVENQFAGGVERRPTTSVTPLAFKNRLLLAILLSVLALLFAIWFAPSAVSNGLRLWLWWRARQQGLTVKIDKIDAPFLRPVVLRGFHMASARDAAFHIEVSAVRATVGLNLKAILMHTSGRAIRSLSTEGLRLEIHRSNPAGISLTESGWATLQKLLPGNLDFGRFDLRVEDGPAVILLRSVSLSASETDVGRFSADEVTIASPWFRQTFSHLRGATKWEDNRLTLAGLSLTRGLDLPSVTADLSRLDKQNVGLDFDVEVFGGKIRASISNEWRSHRSNWNLVGSAADISLTQTSEAIGFTDQLGGVLHACKFTFRGNSLDLTHATASLWTEVTGLTWRDRAADVIMLGAALYNRQVELEQLYVKQKKNQLTMSGEASFPTNSSDWLKPDFRGDISASISNLGDFASLFGANPGDFAGEIAIEGTINASERKIGGHLTATGSALTIFKAPIDLLTAKINVKSTQLEIEELELERGKDFLRAQGKIDISHEHGSRGTLALSVRNLSDYAPNTLLSSSLGLQLIFQGRTASIDSLQLQDGPIEIAFNGTIDFTDLQNVGVTLVPSQALFDLSWLPTVDCVNALQFLPAENVAGPSPGIEKIDLHGDARSGRWNIALKKDAGPDEEDAICVAPGGRSLKIGVRDRGAPEFGQAALRGFQYGDRQPLSFSLDRP